MATFSKEELQYIATQVKPYLLELARAESLELDDVAIADSYSGVTAIPAYDNSGGLKRVVRVPLSVLAAPAENAAAELTDIANHPTYIGEDYYVYRWNNETKVYEKTDIYVKGEGFKIDITWASEEEMQADTNVYADNTYGMISTGDVEQQENGVVYVYKNGSWEFLVDMSGKKGDKGDKGDALTWDGMTETEKNEVISDISESIGSDIQGALANVETATNNANTAANNADEAAENANNVASQVESKLSEWNASEATRESNEDARIEAENARKTEESKRVSAEAARATEFETIKSDAEQATTAANEAADTIETWESVVVTIDEEGDVNDVESDIVNEAIRKTPQTLTIAEKTQARTNIGAASLDEQEAFITEVNENNETFKNSVEERVTKAETNVSELASEVSPLATEKVDYTEYKGKFINTSLQFTTSSSPVAYSSPILVKKGERCVAKLNGTNIMCVMAKSDSEGNLIEKIYIGDGAIHDYIYEPTDDTYIVICYFYTDEYSVVKSPILTSVYNHLTEMGNMYDASMSIVGGLSEMFSLKDISPIENIGKFFAFDGNTLTTSQPFCITEPIKLEVGDAILLTASASYLCSLVTEVTAEGDFIKSLFTGENNETSKGFIAESPMYVALSYNYSCRKEIKIGTMRGRGYVSSIVNMTELEDKYYDYAKTSYLDGNGIWKSKTIEIADDARITFGSQSPIVTSNTALLTFLNAEGDYITHAKGFSQISVRLDGSIVAPNGTRYVVVQNTTANIEQTTIIISVPTTTSVNDRHSAFTDLAQKYIQEGVVGVSAKFYANTTNLQVPMKKEEGLVYPFFDVNAAISQYETEDNRKLTDGLLQYCGTEVSFSPEDENYTRIVIGKDSEDVFYIAYLEAHGKSGNSAQRKLEYTTDFKEFKTLWKDATLSQGDGIVVPNIGNIKPLQIREMVDGSLIVAVDFYDFSVAGTDDLGNQGANSYFGYFRINAEKTDIVQCAGIDLNGEESKVIGTHEALNGYYVKARCYDWHMSVHGSKILVSEYGSRDPITDWGRVWYSEDNGLSWKEVFRAVDHYQDGVDGEVINQTHIHGVMIDTYTDDLFVIAGEDNSNLFVSKDKGATWEVIPIRRQLLNNPNLSYMQVVNGMPFKNCIIFGSDVCNFGGFLRLNRIKDGGYSELEYAYATYPFQYSGTKYCAGGSYRRDMSSPFLMCITRENMESTEAANEGLMQSHLGRIVASYDGYKFYEIWKDDTFGNHSVIVDGEQTSRNFCYCTRDMTAWLCNNGNLVLKYAGREHVYLGSTEYTAGYGDFCSKVRIFKRVENIL